MKRKNIIALILALAMLAALFMGTGCSKNEIVAKVGEREIKLSQFENMYNNYLSYASYYGFDTGTEEGIEAFQDYLIEMMLASLVEAQEAELRGYTLTDEEKAAAQETADASYADFWQDYLDAAENAGASNVEAYANELLTDTLVQNGTTLRKLKQSFLDDAIDDALIAKLEADIIAEADVSDEAIDKVYEEELATQKEAFDKTPSSYFTYEMLYAYGYSEMPLYYPEGFFYVKNILVADEETAQEVLDKLAAGEDFDSLLSDYTTDSGMVGNPGGYIVGEGANFVTEFLTAALALENEGDISDKFETEHGWHIVCRGADVPSGPITDEDTLATYRESVQEDLQNGYLNGMIDTWMASDYVTIYTEVFRSVGKAALANVTPAPEATDSAAATDDAEATAAPEDAGDGEGE